MGTIQDAYLKKIQDTANELNQQLYNEFKNDPIYRKEIDGGYLFAGRYYAESEKIYISLNPGGSKDDDAGRSCFYDSLPPIDWYWGYNDPEWCQKYAYPRNSNYFFHSVPKLETWMATSKFTSTFVRPWRTLDIDSLKGNPVLEKRVIEYSGKIIQIMFEHCHPQLVIISGKGTLKFLAEYLNITIPWAGLSYIDQIGHVGCIVDGYQLIARQDLILSNGQNCSYGVWKKPSGRKYLVCQNETNYKGEDILWTKDEDKARHALEQVASGVMQQEFYQSPDNKNTVYQWGKFISSSVKFFMIPHFTRASDRKVLSKCAEWLCKELIKSGYKI